MKPNNIEYHTNVSLFRLCGFVIGGSLLSKIRFGIQLFLIVSETCVFGIYLVKEKDALDAVTMMETGHWFIVFFSVAFWKIQLARGSGLYCEMAEFIESGALFDSAYNSKQIGYIKKANARIVKLTRMSVICYFFALITTLSKRFTFSTDGSKEYVPFFNGWFPFEINTLPRLYAVCAYQFFAAISSCFGGSACFFTFITMANYIIAHLQVLLDLIKELMRNETESKQAIRTRIKKCIELHCKIIRLFKMFQKFVGLTLLCLIVQSELMLCTLGYLLTNPNTDATLIITFSGVIVPEVCLMTFFCFYGQRFIDLSSRIGDVLYESPWFVKSQWFQSEVLLWMRLLGKPLEVTGWGFRFFHMRGLKEVLQASYTYFNVLKAREKPMN